MNAIAVRHTAEERREEILHAAVTRFGQAGLHGTSTETIAGDVGVSQPYLFRLFGTKKELFIAALVWGFDHAVEVVREAGASATNQHDAFRRIGFAYQALVEDPRFLGIQLQAYASTDDADIQAVVKEHFGRIVTEIVRHTDATPEQLVDFLGRGMLLNVASSMGLLRAETGWAAMVRAGCIGGFDR